MSATDQFFSFIGEMGSNFVDAAIFVLGVIVVAIVVLFYYWLKGRSSGRR